MLTRPPRTEPVPRLEPAIRPPLSGRPVAGVLLLAHGGKERSHHAVPRRSGPVQRMRWIGGAVAARLADHGVATHVMRFRFQGWNGSEKSPVEDVRWAVGQLAERYGADVPVTLVGHSLGGRAVVNAADTSGVAGVLGLAAWLPPTEPTAQLDGRRLLLAHGTQDRVTSPRSSFEYAARARAEGHTVARIVLPGSGHTLLQRARDWNRLVLAFAHLTLVEDGPPPRYTDLIDEAFTAEAPLGLQRVLVGDGRVRH
jgi:predicted esterase